MRTFKTTGIIIKRKNIGEADRILTILTQDLGKIQVKAKGVRKITSKRASHIEPLNHAQLTLYKTQQMPVLTEVATVDSFSAIKGNLPRMGMAYHVCELVDSLCPEGQENTQVFVLLQSILEALATEEKVGQKIHKFEIDLLSTLGYVSSDQDLSGAKASFFIESLLERKLKTRQILPHLL